MKNTLETRLLVALVVLLCVGGLVTAVLWTRSPEREAAPALSPEPEVAALPMTPQEVDAPEHLLAPETQESGAPRTLVSQDDLPRAERVASALSGPTEWLEGRVRLPEGTPADERARVLLVSKAMKRRALYREGGPASPRKDSEPSAELLSSADVGADGSFRIECPAGPGRGHLAVAGRYLYSQATTEVAVPSDRPLVLPAELGAWISGRLVPPAGASGAEAELAGIEVEIEADFGESFRPMEADAMAIDRETEALASGAFELPGVPSGTPLQLVAKPEALAVHVERDLVAEPGQHVALELRLVRGGAVTGRVVDDEGHAVEDADVAVRHHGLAGMIAGELRETDSAEDGRFVLAAVTPGEFVLEARKKGYLQGRVEGRTQVTDGATLADQEIVLRRGQALTGVVLFASGLPAARADVEVTPDFSSGGFGMGAGPGGSAETDDEGRFHVSGLTESTYTVSASWSEKRETSEDGEASAEEPDGAPVFKARLGGIRPGGEPLSLTLAETPLLSGVVTGQDGTPVPSFTVRATLHGSGGLFGLGAETADEDFEDEGGRFELAGLLEGKWTVKVTAPGYGASADVEALLPTLEPLAITLPLAASAAGVVLDTQDRPVAGARVGLRLGLSAMIGSLASGRSEVFSGPDGTFELAGLDPGSASIFAALDGFASSEAAAVELVSGQTTTDLLLRLRVGGTLTGEVYGRDGKLAAGQTVTLQMVPDYERTLMRRTGPDGTFKVEHLDPGKWQVVSMPDVFERAMGASSAEGEGDFGELFKNMSMELVEIGDGEEQHVVLGAPPEDPVLVRGRVLEGDTPLADAMVSFVPEGAQGWSGLDIVGTDDQGEFELELDHPGKHLVTVQTGMEKGHQISVEFVEDVPEDEREHEVTLHMPGGRVSGRVRGADGEPLGGVRVSVTLEGGLDLGTVYGGQYAESSTEDDGTYVVPHLRPGTYAVSTGGVYLGGLLGGEALGGRTIRSGVRVAAEEHVTGVDFRLEPPADLRVVARDAQGAPLVGATVFVRDERGLPLERFSFVTTDAGGRAKYAGVAPGRYTVSARAEGLASPESRLVQVAAGEGADFEIVLVAATKLCVEVVDKDGAPIAANVSVVDAEGREVSGLLAMDDIANVYSEYSVGRMLLGPLPPGDYKVTATTPDGRAASKPVSLSGQAERTVKLRIK